MTPKNRLMEPAGSAKFALWFCVLLVSCNVILVERSWAHALKPQDPLQPAAIVPSESSEQASNGAAPPADRSESAPVDVVAAPAVAVANPLAEGKTLIDISSTTTTTATPEDLASTNKSAGAPEEQPATKDAASSTQGPDTTSQKADSGDSASLGTGSEAPASTGPTSVSTTTERDLKSLLESQNDAENDLAVAPAVAQSPSTKAPASKESNKSDAPVEVKPNDDRFHYSLGSSTGDSKPDSPFSGAPGESQDTEEPVKAAEKPELGPELEGKKLEAGGRPAIVADSNTDTKVIVDAAPASKQDESELEPKNDKIPDTTTNKPTDEPTTTTTTTTEIPVTASSERPASAATTEASPPVAADTSTAAAAAASTSDKPVERDGDINATKKSPPAPEAAESATSKAASETTAKPSEPTSLATSTEAAPAMIAKSDAEKAAASESAKPAVSSTPVQATSAAAATDSLSVAVASAVGSAASAAGAAAGSTLGSALAGKDKPQVVVAQAQPAASSGTTTPTTTTRAPSSVRKSTTNKWNRWQPTGISVPVPPVISSTLPPPTRRRPILPSIRRRFRPHNRFSPFPWAPAGGPETYSPFEPSMADAEPDFSSLGGNRAPFLPSSPQPMKPKRRSTTTMAPTSVPTSVLVSSKTPGRQPVDSAHEDGDDEVTPNVSTRRRNPGGKRRHHHNNHPHPHHHHRHHESAGRRHYGPAGGDHDDADDELGHEHADSPHTPGAWHKDKGGHSPGQQRPQHNHHRPSAYGGGRHESFGGGGSGDSIFEPFSSASARPLGLSPGFGLFNSGGSSSTGSGFDLLNPFSWLDEVTKPRPPVHSTTLNTGHQHNRPDAGGINGRPQPGSGPIPVEGEYNSGRPVVGEPSVPHPHGDHHDHHNHDHHDHHHPHHNHRDRPHRRPERPSREDFDDRPYDCHGHDEHYEHDRPQRPYRPIGGRPIRDDDYDSSYGGGRRPVGGGYGSRPDREPFDRSGEATSSPSTGRGETEASGSSSGQPEPKPSRERRPASRADESSVSSSTPGLASGPPPRRVPASVFSPFDSLFGSIHEDVFGGLRSSFVDAPLKAAADSLRRTNAAFDAIVSSPKIVLPGSDINKSAPESDKPVDVVKPAAAQAPSISTGKLTAGDQAAGSDESSSYNGASRGLEEFVDRMSPSDKVADAAEEARPDASAVSSGLRGGLKHFLLLI